jgi:hypothetical protein
MYSILIWVYCVDKEFKTVYYKSVMAKRRSDPVHCWLVWRKAEEAARDYLYRGIEETRISDTACRFSRETFRLRFAAPGSIVKVQASP